MVVRAALESYMEVVGVRNRRRYAILDKNLIDVRTLKSNDERAFGSFVKDIKCNQF